MGLQPLKIFLLLQCGSKVDPRAVRVNEKYMLYPLSAGYDYNYSFISLLNIQLFNMIKGDINQQDFKSANLHFVKFE